MFKSLSKLSKPKSFEVIRAESELLAKSIDLVEYYKTPHALRVAAYSRRIGVKMGLSDQACFELYIAALLHDVGKTVLSLKFLAENRTLTFFEKTKLLQHSIVGEKEAANRKLPKSVQLLIRWHHENWDGSGYPDSLSRNDIPLAARILRAADVFCSLTSERPYRPAHEVSDVLKKIRNMAALELDPEVVKILLELEEINNEWINRI